MNKTMKYRLLGCLVFMIFVNSATVSAQDVNVRFHSKRINIESAFQQIEQQTGYLISYKETDFDTQTKIQLTDNIVSLTDALDQLLVRTNRSYVFSHKNILIVPAKKVNAPLIVAETSSTEVEELISDHEEILVQEGLSPISELSREGIPFQYPELDRASYFAQSHVSRGKNGRPGYLETMPRYTLKINLLQGAVALAPNLRTEIGLTPKTTIDLGFGINGWKVKGNDDQNKKLAHWIVSAEYRYWFCERFNGHFVGVHAFYGYYNISEHNIPVLFGKNSDKYRYKGNGFGAGISYGYQFMLGQKWNLELNGGIGVGRLHYDRWSCPRCGDLLDKGKNRTFFGPTRAGITLMYIIK